MAASGKYLTLFQNSWFSYIMPCEYGSIINYLQSQNCEMGDHSATELLVNYSYLS